MTERDDQTERLRPTRGPHAALEASPTGAAGEPRYRILGSIHRGGMGEILLAKVEGAQGFARKLVLKGLLSRLAGDDVSYQLFMREAAVMACLDHPNIVRVFDLPYVDGKPFLAMEYLRGRNFHQVIQRSGAEGGMPLRIALYVVAEALRGLHYAHNARDEGGRSLGVVHRDVSPGNILVSFFGEVKVTDFGIAKTNDAPRYTGPRSIRGKARYVAPEQIHGDQATVQSDIYSAGVVLAEALVGHPLWERATIAETLYAVVSEDREQTIERVLANRPGVPALRAALRGGLALDPRDRFATALQFAETLEAIARSLGSVATHVELGLWVRKLFADAPDLPAHDGFGATDLPAPDLQDEELVRTDPTVFALDPDWRPPADEATRQDRPSALPGDDDRPRPPHAIPVAESEALLARSARRAPAQRRADSGPRVDSPFLAPAHPPALEPLSHSFSELIPVATTDEESSRDLGPEIEEALALDPRRTSRLGGAPPGGLRPTGAGLRLLVAGILIGASLALAGCLLALGLAR